ncbi:MAG: hypothetical protein Q4D23_05925, partial [Bacteroidales bacterium]|nr:hypothetical protein [Bacteroidales bacterium]
KDILNALKDIFERDLYAPELTLQGFSKSQPTLVKVFRHLRFLRQKYRTTIHLFRSRQIRVSRKLPLSTEEFLILSRALNICFRLSRFSGL